jgi:hypothetical protein
MLKLYGPVSKILCAIFFVVTTSAESSKIMKEVYNHTDVGMWEGDFWIPPSGKLYGLAEMFEILEHKHVLVIGDSLGRRMTSTMAFLLAKYQDGVEDLSAHAVDVDAKQSIGKVGHGDYDFNVSTAGLRFEWGPKLQHVVNKSCRAVEVSPVTDVLIDIGIHDSEGPPPGNSSIRYNFYHHGISTALTCLSKKNYSVFWRTAPYADFGSGRQNMTVKVQTETQMFNQAARESCKNFPRCVLVDAELLLRHRSFDADRLAGDSSEHFGSLARLSMVQLFLRAMKLTGSFPDKR